MSKRAALMEELRSCGEAELGHRLQSARDELLRLRFQQTSRQLTSPARLRQVRKDIARILIVLSQRERAGQ
jgi:large subunit ribosomal protein L29